MSKCWMLSLLILGLVGCGAPESPSGGEPAGGGAPGASVAATGEHAAAPNLQACSAQLGCGPNAVCQNGICWPCKQFPSRCQAPSAVVQPHGSIAQPEDIAPCIEDECDQQCGGGGFCDRHLGCVCR